MDGIDRKKLPAADLKREEYLKKHGSFLYCTDRDTLCVHMDGMWMTGCERDECILDDPEYKKLQNRIKENRKKAAEEQRKKKEEEKKDPPAQIRNQSGNPGSVYARRMAQINELERKSEIAFRRNNPKEGESLFAKARFMRMQLFEEQKKRRK